MKWFWTFIIAVLILCLGISYKCYSELRQQLDLHFTEDKSNSPLLKTAVTKYFISSNHQKLAYWYFPVKNAKAVVILVHGFSNPGGKTQMIPHVEYLQKAGYTTIVPDLRSFGESEGQKISLGSQEWHDVVDVYNLVKSFPENKNKKVGYLGVSMGASTVIVAAAQSGLGDFVIASVPFKSFDSLAKFRLKDNKYLPIIMPFMKLASYFELGLNYPKYFPETNIGKIHVPILIFQAQKDEFVNKNDAQDLYNLANSPKYFWSAASPHDIHYNLPSDFELHVLSFLAKIH
jgi:alpha-beta hydrolase superfamily lysophospholipase